MRAGRCGFRVKVLSVVFALVCWMPGAVADSPVDERPNILFILADDLGYGDLSSYGSPDNQTPVLDQLAADGVQLTQAYANSAVCSPTRTALLTGNYQYRIRVGLEEPIARFSGGIPKEQVTLAEAFKAAGYNTALIGKWHLGMPPENGPTEHGYDHFFGFYPGGVDYFAHKVSHGKVKIAQHLPYDGLWVDDLKPTNVDGYLTDVFGDQAQQMLARLSEQGEPFFLSLHFSAPHWPWEGPNDVTRSKDLTIITDHDGGNGSIYAAMVASLDANIGRVLAKLEGLQLSDNTIVVFTSDNGGERFSYNWPYIGKKGELLEGGIRVPGIVRWPKAIAPNSSSDQVVMSMDWMPTLLAAADVKTSDLDSLDGVNVLNMLTKKQQSQARDVFWRYKNNDQAAVRSGNWKYLRIKGGEYLFDLSKDSREQADLKRKFPKIFEALKKKYRDWDSGMLSYPEDSYSHDISGTYTDRY